METTTEKKCFECEKMDPLTEYKTLSSGKFLCDNCYGDNYFTCEDCSEIAFMDDGHSIYDDYICDNCYNDNYFYCERCGNNRHNDNRAIDYCDDCTNDDDNDDNDNNGKARPFSKGNESTESGKRAYSCEIECYYPNSESLDEIAEKIPSCVGFTNDGSLNNRGKEFQTPKLSGAIGETTLKKLCRVLNKNSFSVDRACGLHIHIDTSDIAKDFTAIKNVFLFYLAFESVLYSFLPYSRRANNYCMPLSKFYHDDEIYQTSNLEDIEKIWYREQSVKKIDDRKKNNHDSTRYAGVNMHSLLANGHIELRHHSGTLDYKKIRAWIDLNVLIIDTISQNRIDRARLLRVKSILQLDKKQAEMFDILQLDETLTRYFTARSKKFAGELKDDPKCVE